jgi:SAM-dependent methyltransferase
VSRRSLWRRVARPARRILHRGANLIDPLVHPDPTGLLPPAHLRIYYYGSWAPELVTRAGENARIELMSRGLRAEHRVLDIGSGIGNLALALKDDLAGGYDGLEIHPEAVAWCQRTISPRYPSFRFHRANVASSAYNPDGAEPASAYRFPFADRTFDFILLASVFTHMLPDEVVQYLREIRRVLKPEGTCVSSFFLLNDQTRKSVQEGRSFMRFDVVHPSGVYRLHDASVPAAAVAYEESFVERVHRESHLRIREIRRGQWWSGAAHDQDVLTTGVELSR